MKSLVLSIHSAKDTEVEGVPSYCPNKTKFTVEQKYLEGIKTVDLNLGCPK
jgi:hypothetical protein